jgi:hypothetical protein
MFLLPVILALTSASEPVVEPQPVYTVVPAPAYVSAPPAARALADDGFTMSYTYVEVAYFSTDIDTVDETTDGFGARASLGLFHFLYGFIGYSREDVDFSGGNADADSFELGVGAHIDLSQKLNLVGEASWVYDDLNSDTVSDLDGSNNGYTLFAGARWMALPHSSGGLEINGGFRWQDREALLSDDKIGSWELGGRYHFLNHFSIGLGYQFLEDDGRWNASGRFSF